MSNETDPEVQSAAAQAAQNVVDDVTSWEYSAKEGQISQQLNEGLREAGVRVSPEEQHRLVEQIDAVKDETSGAPQIEPEQVTPADEG